MRPAGTAPSWPSAGLPPRQSETLGRAIADGSHAVAALGLAAALVIGITAGRSPHMAIALCVAVPALVVMIRSLLGGLVLFTIVTFPNNLPHALGAGATLAKPLGLVLLLSWVLALVSDRETPILVRDAPAVGWTAIAFVGWAALSVAWAPDPGEALGGVLRLVQVILLLFIAYSAVRSDRDLWIAACGFVLAASATSAYALANGKTRGGGRLSGGIQNPNFLAASIIPALAICGFMLATRLRPTLRLAVIGAVVLNAAALLATGSRGALVALAATLVAAVVFAGRYRPKVLASALVIASLGVAYLSFGATSGPSARLTDISLQASNGRAALWNIALNVAADHPLGGIGIANFPVVESRYSQDATVLADPTNVVGRRGDLVVHNTYLEILAELGLVGLLLFVSLIALTFGSALRRVAMLDATRAGPSAVARGVIVGTVGLLVNYVFDSGEFQRPLWLLLGLVAAVGGSRAARSVPAAAAEPAV